MAVTIAPLDIRGNALRIIKDANANATAENNVNDGAGTLYAVRFENAAVAAASFLKLYNVTPVTVGTTDPDMILMCPASVNRTFIIRTGTNFATALSYACVTTAGTAGTTNPTATVLIDLLVG